VRVPKPHSTIHDVRRLLLRRRRLGQQRARSRQLGRHAPRLMAKPSVDIIGTCLVQHRTSAKKRAHCPEYFTSDARRPHWHLFATDPVSSNTGPTFFFLLSYSAFLVAILHRTVIPFQRNRLFWRQTVEVQQSTRTGADDRTTIVRLVRGRRYHSQQIVARNRISSRRVGRPSTSANPLSETRIIVHHNTSPEVAGQRSKDSGPGAGGAYIPVDPRTLLCDTKRGSLCQCC